MSLTIEHHFKYSPYYEAYGDEKKYLTKKEFDDLGKKISENAVEKSAHRKHVIPKIQYFPYPSTPLVHAVTIGTPELVKILLEHNADPDQKIGNRQSMEGTLGYFLTGNPETSPLLRASYYGDRNEKKDKKYLRIVKLLLQHGAKVDVRDDSGTTPLHHSANFGLYGLVRLMLKAKANIDERDGFQKTPLMFSAGSSGPKVTKYLIRKGADINAADKEGNTPLHYAARSGNVESVKLLLAAGANPLTRETKHGWKPSD